MGAVHNLRVVDAQAPCCYDISEGSTKLSKATPECCSLDSCCWKWTFALKSEYNVKRMCSAWRHATEGAHGLGVGKAEEVVTARAKGERAGHTPR